MSVELSRIVDDFGQRAANPFYRNFGADSPRVRYLIAMTPRSGSTLLARQLSALSVGHPQEFLNEGFIASFDLLFPTPSLSDFESFVVSNFTSSDGVFGLKADWSRFKRATEINYLPRMQGEFDLYVYLRRNDFVSQAISLEIAAQTGIWEESSARYANIEDLYSNLKYDEAALAGNIIAIMEQEYQWTKYLQRKNAPVLKFTYEDIVANLDDVAWKIAKAVGVSADRPLAGPQHYPLKPVPSRVNSEWKLRFLAQNHDFVAQWTRRRGLVRAT
jgi:LPS sulfotransferase NodH